MRTQDIKDILLYPLKCIVYFLLWIDQDKNDPTLKRPLKKKRIKDILKQKPKDPKEK